MQLSYTLSLSDMLTFNKIACRRLAAKARNAKLIGGTLLLNIFAWTALAYTSAGYFALRRTHPELSRELTELVVGLGIAIVFIVASHFYQQRRLRASVFSEKSWLRTPQALSATPAELEVATSGASTRYEWSRFTDCVEDASKLYLFLDLSCAVVVPKSAFGTSEELAQFRVWAGFQKAVVS